MRLGDDLTRKLDFCGKQGKWLNHRENLWNLDYSRGIKAGKASPVDVETGR